MHRKWDPALGCVDVALFEKMLEIKSAQVPTEPLINKRKDCNEDPINVVLPG